MRRLLGAGVLGACVWLAGVASGASAPTLNANKHIAGLAAIVYGRSLNLSGHESLGGSQTAILQADTFPFSGGFHTLKSVHTTGNYSFAVSPSHATRYRVTVGPRSSAILSVYVLARTTSLSCNLCHPGNTPGTHTLTIAQTIQAPPGQVAIHGSEYFYYALASGTSTPPNALKLVKTVPLHINGHTISYTVSSTVTFPNTLFEFDYATCYKDEESTDGIGLPGHHHCGDASISRNEYLG
jgi:hypothetical protein